MTRPGIVSSFERAIIIKIQSRCALITRFSFVVRRTVRRVEREGRGKRKDARRRETETDETEEEEEEEAP